MVAEVAVAVLLKMITATEVTPSNRTVNPKDNFNKHKPRQHLQAV
jgi:hypothetical protein